MRRLYDYSPTFSYYKLAKSPHIVRALLRSGRTTQQQKQKRGGGVDRQHQPERQNLITSNASTAAPSTAYYHLFLISLRSAKLVLFVLLVATIFACIVFFNLLRYIPLQPTSSNGSEVELTKMMDGDKMGESTFTMIPTTDPSSVDYNHDKAKDPSKHRDDQTKGRYIAASVSGCGRLGNMLWRFVSLYGIGRKVGRKPYFHPGGDDCYRKFIPEVEKIFPAVAERMLIIPDNPENSSYVEKVEEVVVDFSPHCCTYEEPLANNALATATAKYVRITGDYLQNYLFFASHHEEEVMEHLLKFAPELLKKIQRLCVHTRRGDHIPQHIESEAPFTEAAVHWARATLLRVFPSTSLVLLGDDRDFNRNQLNFTQNTTNGSRLNRVYHLPEWFSRGEDLCFAATHCDSLLITSPASTYAWWIGYLMAWRHRREQRRKKFRAATSNEVDEAGEGDGEIGLSGGFILYNGDMGRTTPGTYSRENFPASWIPLVMLGDREKGEGIVAIAKNEIGIRIGVNIHGMEFIIVWP